MRMSIRWKLILSIVIPLLFISFLVVPFTLNVLYENAQRSLHESARSLARDRAALLDAKFQALAQVAESSAAFLEIHTELSEKQLFELLHSNLNTNDLAYGSAIAFEVNKYKPDQGLFAPYVFRHEGAYKSIDIAEDSYDYSSGGWEWYSRPRLFSRPVWTEPFFDEGAGNILMVTYSVPFYRASEFAGVVTVDVNLAELQTQVKPEHESGMPFVIISSAGNFISHPDSEHILNKSIQDLAAASKRPDYISFAEEILRGREGSRDLKGITLVGIPKDSLTWIFYTPIESTGWIFSTAVAESKMTENVREQLQKGLLGICVLILLIIVSILLVSSRFTRPLEELSEAVVRVAAGELNAKVNAVSTQDEIGDLARGFNAMLDALNSNLRSLGQEMAARELVEKELNVARDIQASLLPHTFPPFPHRYEFDLHALNQAARHVGGDFFDFFLVDEDALIIVLADVSGKGVPAAIVMAVARTIIRNLGSSGASPAEILAETNRLLLENDNTSSFITLFIAYYEPSNGKLIYSNAGHQPPYRLSEKGELTRFEEAGGTIVGMLDDVEYKNSETRVEKGEYLIMYTDGVSEARSPSGNFYGESYFENLLISNAGASADEICELALNELNGFQAGKLSDDITLLVFRRLI